MPIEERTYSEPSAPWQGNIESLFIRQAKLVVPKWQREYSWSGEKEVEDLLDDLTKFVENSRRQNYLLGSIITFSQPTNTSQHMVVDGQQRILTLFILLCALHSTFQERLLADFPAGDIPEEYKDILEAIKRCVRHTSASGTSLPVSMEYGNGNLVLEKIVNNTFPEIDEVTQSQEKIMAAYTYCRDYLQRHVEDKVNLRNFAKGVLQGVFISEIFVNDLRQALEIFIKLNNRGKDLEDSDLIKNYLFQAVPDDQFENISNKWAGMSKHLRRSSGNAKLKNSEFFLRNWALYRLGQRLSGEYPVWDYWERQLDIATEKEAFLSQLESKAKEFSYLIDSKYPHTGLDNVEMQGSKFLGGTQFLPLLMAGVHLHHERFVYLSKLVNARFLSYVMSLERTQDFEAKVPIWARAISKLSADANEEAIEKCAYDSEACLSANDVTQLKTYISSLHYEKQKKKIRLILAMVAKKMQAHAREDDLELSQYLIGFNSNTNKGFDLDHICPQSRIPPDTDSVSYSQLFHGLGNLVLVNGKQRLYQDKEPIEKVPLYKEGSLLSKSLTLLDESADQVTRVEWHRIQSLVPYSLENWDAAIVTKRRDFLIDEFVGSLPDVILGRKTFS